MVGQLRRRERGRRPRVSVVIVTYEWPEALRLCLTSLGRQTVPPDEIVVADDGSGPETRTCVLECRERLRRDIRHVWQPDEGHGLAIMRNKGFVHTTGDYIVSLDGDMVLHPRFIEDHLRFYAPGRWVQGNRVWLREAATRRMLDAPGSWPRPWEPGIEKPLKLLRMPWLQRLLLRERLIPHRPLGAHQAYPREMLHTINGFNEAFIGWGNSDADVVVRLTNAGLPRIDLNMAALGCHLFHENLPRDRTALNARMVQEAKSSGQVWAPKGMDQWLADPDRWLYESQHPGS